MSVGRKITKEQAEACMRADSRFWVTPFGHKPFRVENDVLQFLDDPDQNEWLRIKYSDAGFKNSTEFTIHADPNGTFERLYGTLTFEQVGAALFRGESVLMTAPDGEDWVIHLSYARMESPYGVARPLQIIWHSEDHADVDTIPICAAEQFTYKVVGKPKSTPPSPKTQEERIAELEARVAELEASK